MGDPVRRHPFPIEKSRGFSHGTLECREIRATRRFFREFLGLDTLRHGMPAFLTWRKDPHVYVACVGAGDTFAAQGHENRWELTVASADEVREAHRNATAMREAYGIREILPVESSDGVTAFALQDLDGNWWELNDRDPSWYDVVFERAKGAA